MIIKMRKYAFMVYHKEYDNFLSALRDLGVVHIQETKSIADDGELQAMVADRKSVTSLMRDFKKLNDENKIEKLSPARRLTKEQGMDFVHSIERLQESRQQLQTASQLLEKDISYMEVWGEFSYENFSLLKKAGWEITFFTCPTAKYEPKWWEEYNAILVNNVQSVSYFVTLTKEGTVIDIDAERPKMPDMGLKELHARYETLQQEIKHIDDQVKAYAVNDYNTLDALDRQMQDEFNLANALVQTNRQAEDKLMFLEGWTTEDQATHLEQQLDASGYYYHQETIEEGDKVPIQLKNNSYSKLFEPITRMFSLPNYAELDPTPLLAPFFMLFFGLCFGDAGYGLLILIATFFLKRKMSPDFRPFITLFQYLAAMTVVVGTVTGSYFGVALVNVSALNNIKDYFLSSDNLMTLSIIIGLVHIVFGKVVAAYKTKVQRGVKYSIAPFAWVFAIVALLLIFGLPVLEIQLPSIVVNTCYGIAIAGLLVAFLYNSPGKNVFLNFGSGLWTLYNVASGLLGDTLSYIRLFAIGLTGSILGGVFNSLAIDMTEGLPFVVRFIVMLLILLLGHGLNIGLCMISSLVHPLRLVFVEYYKNSEFEGGGKEYQPFKKA